MSSGNRRHLNYTNARGILLWNTCGPATGVHREQSSKDSRNSPNSGEGCLRNKEGKEETQVVVLGLFLPAGHSSGNEAIAGTAGAARSARSPPSHPWLKEQHHRNAGGEKPVQGFSVKQEHHTSKDIPDILPGRRLRAPKLNGNSTKPNCLMAMNNTTISLLNTETTIWTAKVPHNLLDKNIPGHRVWNRHFSSKTLFLHSWFVVVWVCLGIFPST